MSYSGTNTIHATFNWNPTYDSYIHLAMWGNDATGDGTKKYPVRTLAKAMALGNAASNKNIVIGAMTLREAVTNGYDGFNFVADGNVIIDVTAAPLFTLNNNNLYTGIYFRGTGGTIINQDLNTATNCTFDGCMFQNTATQIYTGCTFKNITLTFTITVRGNMSNTFFNCSALTLNYVSTTPTTKCVFKNCNIFMTGSGVAMTITYCNFYNCYFKFGTVGTLTQYITLSSFLAAAIAGLSGASASNIYSIYFIDPLFNNEAIGDLTLAITSPCKNMAYDGTLIGAQSIGVSLVGSTTAASSAFDNSSAVNITIDAVTGALTMTDTTINSAIVTKPIANLAGRNIANLTTFGFNSDRNGEYIDSTPDLDLTGLYAAGDTLTVDRIYMVDGSGGQVNYNSTNFAVGDRFVCKTGATTFSNVSVAAFVREIIEGPTRNNIEARFSNGTGTMKSNNDTLTADYWYYLTGTAILSGNSYTAGQFIKGDGTAVTLSTGTLEEVFTTDAYQYYESFGSLTCNRTGNVFTGDITKGNGDPSFDRTSANVFKIAAKYIQIRYTIQANNLTP